MNARRYIKRYFSMFYLASAPHDYVTESSPLLSQIDQ
jgi:hypothetical protein